MKRRETKGGYEDRLSGLMPDPSRLSAVWRSPLVRAGSRWLTFARGLSHRRGRRMAAADAPGFLESLYGGRFTPVEGGAFPLDKVYRTTGGRLHVSETRLSVSVHPRFDLRLLNVAVGLAASHAFREMRATTLLSHAAARGHEQQREVWHVTNNVAAAPSVTVQAWNVSRSGAERVPQTFNYVSVRGQRAQQTRGLGSARPAVRVERVVRGDATTGTSAETSRPTVTTTPASLRLTSLDLRQFVTHAPRQEFVNVLLNTYLPAAVSRELLSVRTAAELSRASAKGATSRGATERRFTSAPGTTERRPVAWTYVEPAARQAPGGVEVRREFRPVETLREHTAPRDPLAPMLHVLPPASLLSSLSETSLTVRAGAAGHSTTYQLGGLAPAPSLRLLRTHTPSPGTREAAAAVDAPRPLNQEPRHRPTGTREVLSSLHTFVERIHSTVAGITRAGNSPSFTRHGFEPTPRRGFGQAKARQRDASSESAPSHTTSSGLFRRSVEFIRRTSVADLTREASPRGAGLRNAPDFVSTRGATGAGAFLFATGLLRRAGAPDAAAMSPTAATALRLAAAAETERGGRETRAARPEGMARELIRHRREHVLELPQPGYVFTQPQRAQLEERQLITKASREEIVEVVRREVRSLTSSAPAGPAPSHAELAGIADEVYSTLARRLLVEKERLGRF